MPKGKKHRASKKGTSAPDKKEVVENGDHLPADSPPPDDEYQSSESSVVEAEEDYFSKTAELSELIDQLSEKSSKTRLLALTKLNKALTRHYWGEFLASNVETLTDLLARGVRKSGNAERDQLLQLAMLLSAQLGETAQSLITTLKPILLTLARDPAVSVGDRAACLSAVGLCAYLSDGDMIELALLVEELQSFFIHRDELAQLCCAALSRWALILSICQNVSAISLTKRLTPVFLCLLDSKSLYVKIAAGQATALLFDLLPEDCEVVDEEWGRLVDKLEGLASENSRHIVKKERNQQRVSFRDLHNAVQTGSVLEQKISIDHEKVHLNSWARVLQYSALKELLGAGTASHMKENPFIRETFDLPPQHIRQTSYDRSMESKGKKYMYSLSSKERSKTRSKQRDKRSDASFIE